MSPVTDAFPPAGRPNWLVWLRRELAPSPGRQMLTLRLVVAVALVTILSMTLQTPETALSAYMVFFVTKENRVVTAITGIGMIVGVTLAIAASLLLYRYTFDYPELRIPVMAGVVFAGMYLSRVFVIGPLGFAIGFVVAITQSVAELFPDAEALTRGLLWVWVAIAYPILVTVALSQVLFLAGASPKKARAAKAKKPLFVPDAFTNPAHARFALKVTLAAMTCYFIYTGLDWSGIHTAFITCCFIALESVEASLRKGWLRLIGCLTGGLLGFLAIMYLIPRMESIVSLVLLIAAVSTFAGWIAAGSERISYAGLQIAFAFFMCVFQGFAPATNFTTIRDRVVGIVLGIFVSAVVFGCIWPEHAANRPRGDSS
jgi:uncharacterized membrane protein YccC